MSEPTETTDYDHGFHAGNHADVWKHVALLALINALRDHPIGVVDTHGGEGEYTLHGEEWKAGIGRLLRRFGAGESSGAGAVDRYLARVRRAGEGRYPGSPRLVLGSLPKTGRLRAHELQAPVAARLRARLADDDRAYVATGDGLTNILPLPRVSTPVVLIDPPFVSKDEWAQAAEAVAQAREAGARVMLWYPVKSWTRPNTLHNKLRELGVPFVAHDLLIRPIEEGSRSLAGSGVLWAGAPDGARIELHAAAAVLGPALSNGADWSLRVTAHASPPS